MVVAGGHDQVTAAGLGAIGDRYGGSGVDEAEAEQVVADTSGQFPAQAVVGRHQQRVRPCYGESGVGGYGDHHLLRGPAGDASMLVVFGQDGGVALAQAQAGGLFPRFAETDRPGQPGIAETVGEEGHAATVLYCLELTCGSVRDNLQGIERDLQVADEWPAVFIHDHRVSPSDQASDQAPPPPPLQWSGIVVQHRQDHGATPPLPGDPGNVRLRPARNFVKPDSDLGIRRLLFNHRLDVRARV
jgi:hypothetical protein